MPWFECLAQFQVYALGRYLAQEWEAEFRLRGFYFVMRDRTDEGVFVQLRPVNPTPEEAQAYWSEARDTGEQ